MYRPYISYFSHRFSIFTRLRIYILLLDSYNHNPSPISPGIVQALELYLAHLLPSILIHCAQNFRVKHIIITSFHETSLNDSVCFYLAKLHNPTRHNAAISAPPHSTSFEFLCLHATVFHLMAIQVFTNRTSTLASCPASTVTLESPHAITITSSRVSFAIANPQIKVHHRAAAGEIKLESNFRHRSKNGNTISWHYCRPYQISTIFSPLFSTGYLHVMANKSASHHLPNCRGTGGQKPGNGLP